MHVVYKAKHPLGLKTLAIYEQLRRQVLCGELPGGTPLDEVSLAESLGVSRTPLREAFQRLAQEGLIEIIPHRGAIVKRLTVQDVREVCQLRLYLEPQAARTATGNVDLSVLDAIEDLLRARRSDETTGAFLATEHEADRQLHGLVLAACGNGRLRSIVENLTAVIERLQVALYPRRLDEATAEHLTIVHCLRQCDAAAAADAMRTHLETTQRALMELIIEQGAL